MRLTSAFLLLLLGACAGAISVPPTSPPVKPPPPTVRLHVLNLKGEVTLVSVGVVLYELIQAEGRGDKFVVLRIDSDGGDFDAAVALGRFIAGTKMKVVCFVDGHAVSAAFYILQTCDARVANEGAFLGAHAVQLGDGVKPTPRLLQEIALANEHMTDIVLAQSKYPREEYKKKVSDSEVWGMTAQMAARLGFITTTGTLEEVIQQIAQIIAREHE